MDFSYYETDILVKQLNVNNLCSLIENITSTI